MSIDTLDDRDDPHAFLRDLESIRELLTVHDNEVLELPMLDKFNQQSLNQQECSKDNNTDHG